MVDFRNVNDALNNNNDEKEVFTVEVVTLSGLQTYEVEEGMTIAEFKNKFNFNDVKIVDEEGTALKNNDTIDDDTQLFISTPKKNG